VTGHGPQPAGIEQRLSALSEDDFRRVVENDMRGRATTAETAALRHRMNAGRWHHSLQLITNDIRAQLKHRTAPGDEPWRHAAGLQLLRAKGRKAEAQARLAELKDETRAEARAAQAKGRTVDEMRGAAQKAAVAMLIAAHRVEFHSYLIDTHRIEGVSLPDSILRSIANTPEEQQ
jgi:hypothetical protein